MIGRTVIPGASIGTRKKLMPSCFFTVLSVRANTKIQLASLASVVQVFWPFSTHSCPSSTADVARLARSEPEFGSL